MLKDMLEELERLDHETWETIYEKGFNSCDWPEDLIQGEIQRACEKREWYCSIAHGNSIGYVASVEDGSIVVEGHSYVDALLRAYLAALRGIRMIGIAQDILRSAIQPVPQTAITDAMSPEKLALLKVLHNKGFIRCTAGLWQTTSRGRGLLGQLDYVQEQLES